MVTKTVQEIYDSIATETHAPTGREIIDAMISDGYTVDEIRTQLTSTYPKEKNDELEAYYTDRATRLPTDKAWKKLSDSECLAESVAVETYKMKVSEAKRILKELNKIMSDFTAAKGVSQTEFNDEWLVKEDSGWVTE